MCPAFNLHCNNIIGVGPYFLFYLFILFF
uniref:Uncharacterized protein n=1 Tax=Anguilla anguilla TaxID=7936 RepID=A0A0E9VMG1_ANGAN